MLSWTSGLQAETSSGSSHRFTLWTVDRLDMSYYKYRAGYRNPYLLKEGGDTVDGYQPMPLVDGSDLNMDLNVLDVLYWRNRFHMASDEFKHVKYVGWEYEGGIDLRKVHPALPIELFEHHHSQHGLEYVNPRGDRFPVEDTYGVRMIFIERTNK